ncbi:GNAT family N-acetyltransferase [Neobacillus sp. D3-1R]|uniref:GNAT family N-acetyltransferase n=1 Tax=Neobacillus sp. D3-1R TaxID=3445778 RepID=UPI003F9EBCDB
MSIIQTERLSIRKVTLNDSGFILRLLNEPSWIQYIGDKGVKTELDAKKYIESGPIKMYQEYGFGLYIVALKELGTPIGLCGLIKRITLQYVDIGFAYLPEYTGQGYAFEAADAVIQYGKKAFSLHKMVAITTLDNVNSQKLLGKLGFDFDSTIKMPHETETLKLYIKNLSHI